MTQFENVHLQNTDFTPHPCLHYPAAAPWILDLVLFVWRHQSKSKFPQSSPAPFTSGLPPHVSSLLYGTSCNCPFTMDTESSAPLPPFTCVKLPEWNQTIVIDRKAEETPHLTSTHAESNYTPSASALAPAWGFRRARGERMGGRD